MGPLVPNIISNEFNFIVALFIGIAFGAILEQAGFSTSKKLVGLFYGYDFTVLRVFFTAGFTAMVGVMALEHFGLLDINLTYINPTFLTSAIVGGLIMGLGFVIGGFCPGTSVCAAAIGKIDGMIFIVGTSIGVLIFAEGYPLWEELYKAHNLGYLRIFDTLGISQTLFGFLLTSVALIAFWVTSIIENKVNGVERKPIRFTPYYIGITAFGILIACSALLFPPRKAALMEKVEDNNFVENYNLKEMTVDEFAFRIVDNDKTMQVFDFRPLEEYNKHSLPLSMPFKVDNFFEKEPSQILSLRHKTKVFIANDELTERKVAIIAQELGYDNIEVLQGGLEKFNSDIINFIPVKAPVTQVEKDTYKFREKAKVLLPVLIEQHKSKGPVVKKLKRVIGGC